MTEPETPTHRIRRKAFTGFGVVMLGVLLFAVFFFLNFTTVVVSGTSMLPTFKTGSRLLATKAYWLVGPLRHDDIVVMREKDGSGYFIKRVFRLPGEIIDVKTNDIVNLPRYRKLAEGSFVVPLGTVYVLGDNREVSSDSREFGPVEMSRVIGKVVKVQ